VLLRVISWIVLSFFRSLLGLPRCSPITPLVKSLTNVEEQESSEKFFAVIFAALLVCFLNEIAFAQSPPYDEFKSIEFRDDNRSGTNWGYLRREDRVLKKGLLSSREGMMLDGFHYQRSVPVQVNSTYLLRSIAYHTGDVLVAFKLVRQDTDGSVIIAWKLLKRYPTPELKRN
jgi:hypothetical protein